MYLVIVRSAQMPKAPIERTKKTPPAARDASGAEIERQRGDAGDRARDDRVDDGDDTMESSTNACSPAAAARASPPT